LVSQNPFNFCFSFFVFPWISFTTVPPDQLHILFPIFPSLSPKEVFGHFRWWVGLSDEGDIIPFDYFTGDGEEERRRRERREKKKKKKYEWDLPRRSMTYMSASVQFLVSSPAPVLPIPFPSSRSSPSSSPSRRMPSSGSSTTRLESPTVVRGSSSSATSFNSMFEGSTLSPPDSATSSRSNSSLSAYPESFSSIEGISAATGVCNGLQTSVRILQECRLSLIHIPLHLYPHFVQAILSLILPSISPSSEDRKAWGGRRGSEETRGYMGGDGDDDDRPYGSDYEDEDLAPGYHSAGRPSHSIENFVNVAVTPVECSVVCSAEQVENLFTPIIQTLSSCHREEVSISEDEFVAIQVDGEGLDAGQRVLDLTSPLALAGV